MNIPIIETCKIEEHSFDKNYKEWQCYFTLKGEKYKYFMEINIDAWDEKTKWEHTMIRKLKKKDMWIYINSQNHRSKYMENVYWEEHIFEILMECIKKHSPNRLRLLSYMEKEYFEEGFQPAVYQPIKQVTFIKGEE